MHGKICLVTGANAGIGLETARQLAQQGAEIILTGRDRAKCEAAQQQIVQETGNTAVTVFIADMSLHREIKRVADEIRAKYNRIDVLVNNVGGVFSHFALTDEGLEKTIATNHFSYFLLTNYLLDLVRASDYARILNVASNSHFNAKMDFASFTANRGFNPIKAYAQSKLANMLFTHELADRLKSTHVTVNAISPGRVDTTIGIRNQVWYVAFIWKALTSLRSISAEKGAYTNIYLATSPEVNGVSGRYYHRGTEMKSSESSYDTTLARQLWTETERLAGISFPVT